MAQRSVFSRIAALTAAENQESADRWKRALVGSFNAGEEKAEKNGGGSSGTTGLPVVAKPERGLVSAESESEPKSPARRLVPDPSIPDVAKAEAGGPIAAGLAVVAADTGRVLMLQRALADGRDDPAAGTWEFPGGHVDAGERPLNAAKREWAEEVGVALPDGVVVSRWRSPDGVYAGFVWRVESEGLVPFGDRDQVTNPDDPDGDRLEAIAWWEPDDVPDNPALRDELKGRIGDALGPVMKKADEAIANAVRDRLRGDPRYYSGALADGGGLSSADPEKLENVLMITTSVPPEGAQSGGGRKDRTVSNATAATTGLATTGLATLSLSTYAIGDNGAGATVKDVEPRPADGVAPHAPESDLKDEVQYLNKGADPMNWTHGVVDFTTGEDDKKKPVTSEPLKRPRLAYADFNPGIRKDIVESLERAVVSLAVADPSPFIALAALASPELGLSWDPAKSDYAVLDPRVDDMIGATFGKLAKMARRMGDGALVNDLSLLRSRVQRALPMGPMETVASMHQVAKAARHLGVPCESPSVVSKSKDTADSIGRAAQAVLRVRDSLEDSVFDKGKRRELDPTIMTAVDALYEDAVSLMDGLELSRFVDHGDDEPEHEVIEAADVENTVSDVEKTDILLDAVNSKTNKSHSQTKCMSCGMAPTKLVKWAEGMALAWFCDRDFDDWKKKNGGEIVWVHDVRDGDVGPMIKKGSVSVSDTFEDPTEDKGGPENLPKKWEKRHLEAEVDKTERPIDRIGVAIPSEPELEQMNDSGHPLPRNVVTGDAPPQHTGTMIAWYPTTGQSRQIAEEGGESADELHVTIAYLGETSDHDERAVEAIRRVLREETLKQPPMDGSLGGVGRFNPSEGGDGKSPVIALVDVPGLSEFRTRIVHALEREGVEFPRDHGFTPHMTIRYDEPGMDDLAARGIPQIETTPISVDKVWLVRDGKREEFTLDSGVGQVSGMVPSHVKAADDDARNFGRSFGRLWSRSFLDRRYRLAVVKDADGDREILELD